MCCTGTWDAVKLTGVYLVHGCASAWYCNVDCVIAQSDASRFMLRRVRVEFPNTQRWRAGERVLDGFPIESPPMQEAQRCSARGAAPAPEPMHFRAGDVTLGTFRQRHAARKSCYAIDALNFPISTTRYCVALSNFTIPSPVCWRFLTFLSLSP